MNRKPIRVLVADDSTTLRTALCALLSEDPHLSIVGQAADGMEAVEKARALRPDVITMDVNMPRLDGLGATAAIMADAPARVLVISSVRQHRQLELSFKAMAAGALELIAKPEGGPEEMRRWARRVAESVRLRWSPRKASCPRQAVSTWRRTGAIWSWTARATCTRRAPPACIAPRATGCSFRWPGRTARAPRGSC